MFMGVGAQRGPDGGERWWSARRGKVLWASERWGLDGERWGLDGVDGGRRDGGGVFCGGRRAGEVDGGGG